MRDITPRVNEIIRFIKAKSKMFWLDDIEINPTSKMLGVYTSYYFYAPNVKLENIMRMSLTMIDNYMDSDSGVGSSKIYDNFFDDFESYKKDQYRISYDFLDKAKSALYDLKIYESIIYAAIAQESFITKYIENISPKSDIVLKRLNKINGELMDLKYNIILKYLKGKSLIEINEGWWNTINGIYKLRNGIMHSGEITNQHLKDSGFAKIDFNSLKKAFSKIEKAFEEIKKL